LSTPEARKGTPDPTLDEGEFRRRFLQPFQDPAFEALSSELQRITDAAWDAYSHHRKSPKTRKADRASPTPITISPSIGSPRRTPSTWPGNGMRTRTVRRVSS
jgi:hypothetical protein